jgi:integrative and conjugative element protein (TIGR02256 family)
MPVPARDRTRLARPRLWLAAGALAEMIGEAQSAKPDETGGVLLGWGVGGQFAAAHAVGPGPRAKHRPTRFTPDTRWQRAQIATEYERSGRILRYLGDWHSHPGGGEQPSARDLRTARRIARSRAARVLEPVMVILSDRSGDWRPAVYRLVNGKLSRMQCEVLDSRGYGAAAEGRLRPAGDG